MNEAPPPYESGGKASAPPPSHPMDQGSNPYPSAYPQAVPTVQTTTVIMGQMYGPQPITMTCPHCQAHIVTETAPEAGLLTWLIAGGCCLFGLWCGCCLLPFCIDDCQDIHHRCPNCKQFLGVYKRLN